MKQVLQNLRSGETVVTDVPCPMVGPGRVLIATFRSVVSAGTERMLVQFARGSLIEKARQQPDKVAMVLSKIATDGLAATYEAVTSKLDQPLALGYCNAGRVLAVGCGVTGFAVGDRVASNGPHAEVVCVPVNLVAKVPDGVSDEAAAFTVIGAVALQGIRLLAPTLGEAIVVTGLGAAGLMAVQLLRAHGCRVFGIDRDPARLALAARFGAETFDVSGAADPVAGAYAFSRGRGVDGVLIAASSTGDDLVHQAALMCRKRGRIVLVGVTGLSLSRADFYEKELTFQVSCAYGPGRYDAAYEDGGQDYPVGFVRWTAQRNFEAVLDMLADGRVDVEPLVSHRFQIGDARAAYALLAGGAPSLGIVLTYPPQEPGASRVATIALSRAALVREGLRDGLRAVSFIGAGQYAGRVLAPAFKAAGVALDTVVSARGVSSVQVGRAQGFARASSDAAAAIADPGVGAVVIATRHDSHARFVIAALEAGKDVFVEKPLCLTLVELAEIEAAMAQHQELRVMVGFNRRFAPLVVRMAALLSGVRAPKAMVMTVNAGALPIGHWTRDREVGGGRIVGEACHFIDLLRHLAGAPIVEHSALTTGDGSGDTASLMLRFGDGSTGIVHYLANGHRGVAKERLEVFCEGRVLRLENFKVLRGWGFGSFQRMALWRQDKGQRACVAAFAAGDEMDRATLMEVSRVAIELQAAVNGAWLSTPGSRVCTAT